MRYFIYVVLIFSLISSFERLGESSQTNLLTYQRQDVGSPILPPISATWSATDGAGRVLPMHETVGNYRPNKYVGIFYFLWHGYYKENRNLYNISNIIKADSIHPAYGPKNYFHWWGEPEIGYFKSDDPWVIRRNLQLLTLAGVDILFFDTTNGDLYLPIVNKLCEISRGMRKQGIPTPYICFVTHAKGVQTVTSVYQQFYAQNRYSDLWFRWQGKPLILGQVEEITDPVIRDFFTWRYCWQFTEAKTHPNHWQWLDNTPQNYGWTTDPNVPEEIPVAVASHPVFTVGKSSVTGRKLNLNRYGVTAVTNEGLHFDEQWKRALKVDPAVVFVTGWNEWIAQRFVADTNDRSMVFKYFAGHKMRQGETFFQDLYNQEFNRDIDPMKGGYTDNYYYQLVANIRRFKGVPAPEPVSNPRIIAIDGRFEEWNSIKPEFIDPTGDVVHRNWPRADNKINYINKTGRNDIIKSRVTYDSKNVYFYVKTAQKLTSSSGKNWMLLFIDADRSAKTGWLGYDYLINRTVKGNKSVISRWNKKAWTNVATGLFNYTNNELELSIPLASIRQSTGNVKFDFHWADNIQKLNTITEFFLNGDNAPDRRFNYRYNSK
ncbi:hypothetical protein [Spirosoma sp. KNUC1025]|uniref:hypothetical protein n=1 Tax=Spirosoma sp. KNUC1025 TaxID=2894082 RepID=UPI00386DD735|nr:hypothetical protein LN737_01490 [Spirosoma sp. KNUC1025]